MLSTSEGLLYSFSFTLAIDNMRLYIMIAVKSTDTDIVLTASLSYFIYQYRIKDVSVDLKPF